MIMIVKGKGHPNYLLSQNSQIRLWHRRLGHASNAKVIQASMSVNVISLGEVSKRWVALLRLRERRESDTKEPIVINKATDASVEAKLWNVCIESKHTRIVKSKKLTPTTQRPQEIGADLWGPRPTVTFRKKLRCLTPWWINLKVMDPSIEEQRWIFWLLQALASASWIIWGQTRLPTSWRRRRIYQHRLEGLLQWNGNYNGIRSTLHAWGEWHCRAMLENTFNNEKLTTNW